MNIISFLSLISLTQLIASLIDSKWSPSLLLVLKISLTSLASLPIVENHVHDIMFENGKIKITEKLTFSNGYKGTIKYSGEFISDKEATLKGKFKSEPDWKCKGRFFKVDRPPHFTPLKYLSEANEEIIKFTEAGMIAKINNI